jgi:uncharacterized protein (DUF1015 family)
MARIIPFKGFRYDLSHVAIEKVVAPPYDVISDEESDILHQRHPNNIVRLTRGKEYPGDGPHENKYSRARTFLAEWIAQGILRRDDSPCIYLYEQQYQYSENRPRIRRGFIALARLADRDSGAILGHEHTLIQPKRDRLNLLRECKANLSPIFSLYSEPAGSIDSMLVEMAFTPPALEFWDDNNIRNRFWVVSDSSLIELLSERIKEKPIIIADGHHRYETALRYRHLRREEEQRDNGDAPYDYVMMMFVNLDGEGVTIYPVHRVIYGLPNFDPERFRNQLKKYFEITSLTLNTGNFTTSALNLTQDMAVSGEIRHTFGLYLGDARLEILRAKNNSVLREMVDKKRCESFRTLDVSVAHAVILQNILGIDTHSVSKEEHLRYTPSTRNALGMVRSGEAQIALLLNPTRTEQVKAVTFEGEKMPQKSTYFYPKLLSGLVINKFED